MSIRATDAGSPARGPAEEPVGRLRATKAPRCALLALAEAGSGVPPTVTTKACSGVWGGATPMNGVEGAGPRASGLGSAPDGGCPTGLRNGSVPTPSVPTERSSGRTAGTTAVDPIGAVKPACAIPPTSLDSIAGATTFKLAAEKSCAAGSCDMGITGKRFGPVGARGGNVDDPAAEKGIKAPPTPPRGIRRAPAAAKSCKGGRT